jgi:iron complex transport system substrate-binding protein
MEDKSLEILEKHSDSVMALAAQNRMKRMLFMTLATVLLFCSGIYTSCRKNDTNPPSSNSREIVDMAGRTVVIPETVNRVFVDWPSGMTLLMHLGATDKLVTVDTSFDTERMAWASIVCPDIANIPRIETQSLNMEEILSYEPDLVITSGRSRLLVEDYERAGFPTVFVTFGDYETFKQSITVIGNILSDLYIAKADKINSYLDSNIRMVTERLADTYNANKKSVYYMDTRGVDTLLTVGVGEIQEKWIEMAGGLFATPEFTGRNQVITVEKLLAIDPDIIIIGGHSQAIVLPMLLNDNILGELSAVKKNQIYRNPYGIFAWCWTGPEFSLQPIWAAKLLHPEKFVDIDMFEMTKNFYLQFFGTNVSDENIEKMLSGKISPNGG